MWLPAGLSLSLVVGHLTMWPLHSLPECPFHMAAGFLQSDNQEKKRRREDRREKRTQYRSHLLLQPNFGNDISILVYSIGHKDQLWAGAIQGVNPRGQDGWTPSWRLPQITRVQTLLITVLQGKITGMTALGNHRLEGWWRRHFLKGSHGV